MTINNKTKKYYIHRCSRLLSSTFKSQSRFNLQSPFADKDIILSEVTKAKQSLTLVLQFYKLIRRLTVLWPQQQDCFQIYSDLNDRNPTTRIHSFASFIPHLSKQDDKSRSWFYFKQEFITNIYKNGVDKADNVDQFSPLKSRQPLNTNLKAQLYHFSAITKRIVINIKIPQAKN